MTHKPYAQDMIELIIYYHRAGCVSGVGGGGGGGGVGSLGHKFARDGTACDIKLITLKCNLRHMFVSNEPKIISFLFCLRVY